MAALLKPSTYKRIRSASGASNSSKSSSQMSHHPTDPNAPPPSAPHTSAYPSSHTTMGAGIAAFHLSTSRVALCSQLLTFPSGIQHRIYFLPKGRLDVNESPMEAAQREGFEESGYRSRILPIVTRHRQTRPARPKAKPESVRQSQEQQPQLIAGVEDVPSAIPSNITTPLTAAEQQDLESERERKDRQYKLEEYTFVSVPLWTQLEPIGRGGGAQYILFWFAGETVPQDVEMEMSLAAQTQGLTTTSTSSSDNNANNIRNSNDNNDNNDDGEGASGRGFGRELYQSPRPFERCQTLKERMRRDYIKGGKATSPEQGQMKKESWYEPVRHEGTGVDAEEATYESGLYGIEDAVRLLGEETVMADVVRRGWEGVKLRMEMEEKVGKGGDI